MAPVAHVLRDDWFLRNQYCHSTRWLNFIMPITALPFAALRLNIDPDSLGFSDTSELVHEPLPWIGQARAEASARFGLGMDRPNYNLFVLGEVGSGRSSLLKQAMHEVAASKRVPPDLCYLHNSPLEGEGRVKGIINRYVCVRGGSRRIDRVRQVR